MTSLPTLVVDRKHALEQSVIDKTLREIMMFDPESYERIERDESKKLVLTNYIRQIVKDQEVPDDFDPSKMVSNEQNVLVQLCLSTDKTRVEIIKDALATTTFTVEIDESKKMVTLKHVGETTPLHTIKLNSRANIESAYFMQVASIVLKSICLVMSMIGLKMPINPNTITTVTKCLTDELATSSSLRRAVDVLHKTWNMPNSTPTTKATALLGLLKSTYTLGIMWTIIKQLCAESSWWESTKITTMATAQLTSALTTTEGSLVAKIILALKNAPTFVKEVQNLTMLKTMRGVDVE